MAYTTRLTQTGLAKVANAMANGAPLNLTKMAVGDGAGNPVPYPTGSELALVREVYRAALNKVERVTDLDEFIEVEMLIPGSVGGWVVREIGLYDADNDLIAYGNFPDMTKVLTTSGTLLDMGIRTTIEVSADANITLLVDSNIVTATRAWVTNTLASVGTLPPGGTTGQVLAKKSNEDYAAEWKDQDDISLIVNAIEEPQTLADSQTVVTLSIVNTIGTAFYVNGLRLRPDQYTINSDTQITLAQSYAADSTFLAVQNEPNSQLRASMVPVDAIDGLEANTTQQALEALAVRNNEQDQATEEQQQSLDDHVNNKDNPHELTPAKLGAETPEGANAKVQAGIKIAAPPGAVMAFALAVQPTGWLECNGAAISRVTYAALFAAIGVTFGNGDGGTTFNLPDLRGEFIRGWDHGRGVDATRGLGSLQESANKSHTHTASSASAGAHVHTASSASAGAHSHDLNGGWAGSKNDLGGNPGDINVGTASANETGTAGAHSHAITVNSAGAHSHPITVQAAGDTESRPRNMALMYCIKF